MSLLKCNYVRSYDFFNFLYPNLQCPKFICTTPGSLTDRQSKIRNDDQSDTDIMALKLIELLTEEHVLTKLRRALYPQEIPDKIDGLNNQIINLTSLLKKKEKRIAVLETKIQKMEENIDHQEQYSRRPNMRIHGVPEHDNEDTTTIVMDVTNSKMSFKPSLESSQLERTHCVRPKLDQQGRVRSRTIIVRFKKTRTHVTRF